MPRATSQSQKGSQQHKRQRASRSRPEPEEEIDDRDDDDDDEEEEEDRMDVDDEENDQENDMQRKANALVRLALFVEYRRTPLRRDDIVKKVMGSNSRAFSRVFVAAQEKLRKVFGMELVELRSRAEIAKDAIGDDDENERKGATSKKKAAPSGSKTYILRSILDPQIIKGASLADEQILEDEAADQPSEDDNDDPGSHPIGSIISWNSADQLGPIGILYVILALILVSGRVITDADLRTHLKKLRLSSGGQVTFTAQSTHPVMTIDTYLTNLVKQGYLDQQQIGETKKKGGMKRVRAQDEDESAKYEWRWGNRAECEIGEQALAEFVAEFMVRSQNDDDDDAGPQQRRGASAFDKMLKGIEKAAGGNLAELRTE